MIEETQDYWGLAPWCSKLDTAPEMKFKLINSWFAHSDNGVHLSYPGHMWKNNEQGQDSPPRCPYSNTTGSNARCGRYVNFKQSQTLREQGIKPRQRVFPASYNLVNKYLSWIFHDFILFYFILWKLSHVGLLKKFKEIPVEKPGSPLCIYVLFCENLK